MNDISRFTEFKVSDIPSDFHVALPQTPQYFSVLCEQLGYRPLFFVQSRDKGIANVLPIAEIHVPYLGTKLISMPLDGTFGGIWGPAQDGSQIYHEVIRYGQEKKVNYVEIRTTQRDSILEAQGFQYQIPYHTSDIALTSLEENIKMLSRGHRSSLNFARSKGVETVTSRSFDDLKRFYQLLSLNFRAFGSPIFPFHYLKALWDAFMPSGNLVLIKNVFQQKMISGIILLLHGKTAVYKYGAALEAYDELRLYQTMIWKAIELSLETGAERLNLGISSVHDPGLLEFKRRFGAENTPTYFYGLPICGKTPDQEAFFTGFKTVKRLWRYVPLPLLNMAGNFIYRWIC